MVSSDAAPPPVRVVGVAGAPGAGKSTLVAALVRALGGGASSIHMDDYQRFTRQPMEQVARWLDDGADFDAFDIPVLPAHLRQLRLGHAVTDPISLRSIPARPVLVFETHFGRAHAATGQHIDLLVWVDTPPDVALARNLHDLLAPLVRGAVPAAPERLAGLQAYLDHYLTHVRRLSAMQRERVGSGADLVVDGDQPPPAQAAQVLARLATLAQAAP